MPIRTTATNPLDLITYLITTMGSYVYLTYHVATYLPIS